VKVRSDIKLVKKGVVDEIILPSSITFNVDFDNEFAHRIMIKLFGKVIFVFIDVVEIIAIS
jgi:hypothetical protein